MIAAIVIVAVGLSVVLGGGTVGPVAEATRPTAATGPSLVSVLPSLDSSLPPVATGTATPGPSSTPGIGIRAVRIQIQRLGIDVPVIEGDGIDAPIGKVAHYPGSGLPGGGSNIYIYGHARVGMFLSLWKVALGDTVVVTLVDGTQRTYLVGKVIPKVPWDAVSYLDPTPTEQLTLQTCNSYQPTAPRFIAIAYPAP